jgi:hypothetical protein
MPPPGKYLQCWKTGREEQGGELLKRIVLAWSQPFPACQPVWKFRAAARAAHTRWHADTHFAALGIREASV